MDRFARNKLAALAVGALTFVVLLLFDPLATNAGLDWTGGVWVPIFAVLAALGGALAAYLMGLKDPRPMTASSVTAVAGFVAAGLVWYALALTGGVEGDVLIRAVRAAV